MKPHSPKTKRQPSSWANQRSEKETKLSNLMPWHHLYRIHRLVITRGLTLWRRSISIRQRSERKNSFYQSRMLALTQELIWVSEILSKNSLRRHEQASFLKCIRSTKTLSLCKRISQESRSAGHSVWWMGMEWMDTLFHNSSSNNYHRSSNHFLKANPMSKQSWAQPQPQKKPLREAKLLIHSSSSYPK